MGAARRAWDAAKHPRGPGGRFVSVAAPPSTSRPSLSDAVLGTAALGPKRQRSARDLMGRGTAARPSAAPSRPMEPKAPARPERTARAAFDAAGVTSELRRATSMTSAREALRGLTVAQLREVGASAGYGIPARTKKAQAIDRLAEIAGRRLDSLAIERLR